ncbi:MAG: ABC transporter ATP-binding protein/permease, partial [Bacteroidetes bacterium]|nr:ABC transporter ATP-binding protein/permease [Bacteroidota bacterium]
MNALTALRPFFFKYRIRLLSGILFILISNYFAVLTPQITGHIIDKVQVYLSGNQFTITKSYQDPVVKWIVEWIDSKVIDLSKVVIYCGIVLLIFAILRGIFMFLMRQTIIVMSRLIEYDQKNEIFTKYQQLDMQFYKTHETGDMMNRMAEDVSRVRAYTGPAIMYLINLIVLIGLSVFYMVKKNEVLSLYVLIPLPVLALIIYVVNQRIHRQSEIVQSVLSDLTSDAQQSYSGIRVIKSYAQEKSMFHFFEQKTEIYRTAATQLYKTEAFYFPVMALIIGISTLLVVFVGGNAYMQNHLPFGDMAAFIMYLTMLTFPVSAIGWVASTIQRASASQKRINEFLNVKPTIQSGNLPFHQWNHDICFESVSLVYPHTGVLAIDQLSVKIRKGQKIAIVGKTGSGKTTLAQLLLRFYDPTSGKILLDNQPISSLDLSQYRNQIAYVTQEPFLFSDTLYNNIAFEGENVNHTQVEAVAKLASIHEEILKFSEGYQTVVGERGITLSGGQKQRIALARAILKNKATFFIFDDCYSAVDAQTETNIIKGLSGFLANKTAIFITHRISAIPPVDQIWVMEKGRIVEIGTHEDLLKHNGLYTFMFNLQGQTGRQKF